MGEYYMKRKLKKQRKLRKCERDIKTKRMNKKGGFRYHLGSNGFQPIY